jgi:hypothetical protein
MPRLRSPELTSLVTPSWSGQALEILAMRGAVSGRRCIFAVATQSPSSRSALRARACRRSNPNGLRLCGQSAVQLAGWLAHEFLGRKEMRIVNPPWPIAFPRDTRNSLATTTCTAPILTLCRGTPSPATGKSDLRQAWARNFATTILCFIFEQIIPLWNSILNRPL